MIFIRPFSTTVILRIDKLNVTFDWLNGSSIAGDNEERVVINRQLDRAVEESVADDAEAIATSLLDTNVQ